MSEKEIIFIVHENPWMMEVLEIVASLKLPDWWIGAGFVRNKVWDVLHGYENRTPLHDIDFIYFDPENIDEEEEKRIEQQLKELRLDLPWSVKNQARMAFVRGDGPYKNAEDGLSRWVETATCVGLRLDKKGKLQLASPLGIDDLIGLRVRLNKKSGVLQSVFAERVKKKKWLHIWPKLRMV
ncbi:MAG: nucleotidyltransferase family protein [bacterium]|nr:nucleotidyltransferase family protein [bacterium]